VPPRSDPRTRIAILTAAFGDGHNTAARNIAAAFDQRQVPNSGATDLLQRCQPDTMWWISAAYRTVITRWPSIWSGLYRIADRMPLGDNVPDITPQITRGLADFLQRQRPDIVISTYPLYGHTIERLFGRGPLPFTLLTMVTDSTTINNAWIHNACGHYAVSDTVSASFFLDHGIAADRVHVTGFPVSPEFDTLTPPPPPEGALPDPLRVLYTPANSTTAIRQTLRSITAAGLPITMTVVLGRHESRLRKLVAAEAPPGSEIIGWSDHMPELLASHHLLIGKAGGASVQESLAAGCPMLVNYIVPGQEEGNAELLIELGAGCVASSPTAVTETLVRLLAGGGEPWREMRRAALRHGRPGAAGLVADLALRLAADAGRIGV